MKIGSLSKKETIVGTVAINFYLMTANSTPNVEF